MQCTETHLLFTDFADNTLSREELRVLTDHLLGCQDCALEWRQFQQTLKLVHGLEAQSPPSDLLPGIQAKLTRTGVFDRIWSFVETLNFSLSIPVAAAIFTIAMLAGFLLKNSPQEQDGIFSSRPGRISSLPQGEIFSPRRPPLTQKTMFAVSHDGGSHRGNPATLARTALVPSQASEADARRLLSPDIHVLIENIGYDGQLALCREMLHRNWQVHRITTGLFLVHLPQEELELFHELLGRHRFALMPVAAAESDFGNNKRVLTAAIRFQ